MTASFNLPPIVERELRVASRRGVTYWSRVGAATSGIVTAGWVLFTLLSAGPTVRAGQLTFRVLAGIAAFMAVSSVLQLSSAAFAREKREDTLGLLFLTPLKPIDLVLGKLVSTSLVAFFHFLAIVPLLGLPILIGGVTAGNFFWLVIGLAHFVLLAATFGLYISAASWDEKRAAIVANVAIFCLAALPALASLFAGVLRQPALSSLFALSPAYPIWCATAPGAAQSGLFWASLLWTHALGWFFFFAACRALPRCWQNRPVNLAPLGEHLRPRGATEQPPTLALISESPAAPRSNEARIRRSVRSQFSAHERAWMLDQNPVFWLAMRSRMRSSAAAWILGALGLVACTVLVATGNWEKVLSPGLALFLCFCVNAAFKTQVSNQASLVFARDRPDDPLQLLLSTPITARELIDGHLHALRKTLRPWICWVLWVEVGWLALTITIHALEHGAVAWLYAIPAVAIVGFLVPDLHAIAWTAMWQSVIGRSAREADRDACGFVLLFPWVPIFLAWPIAVPVGGPLVGGLAAVITWMISSAIVNRWFGRRARHNLETRLHLWALRRSAGEFEFYDGWRRLGRWLGQWWRRQFYRQ